MQKALRSFLYRSALPCLTLWEVGGSHPITNVQRSTDLKPLLSLSLSVYVRVWFAKVLLTYIFHQNGPSGDARMRFEEVKAFVVDLLTQIPASSVEVEKHHANCQVDCAVHRYNAKRAPTTQANSLIMSAMLDHQALKQAAEGCAFGKAAGRVKRLLKQRVVGAPGQNVRAGCTAEQRYVQTAA